jgi:uncharacterized membrane protein
MRAAHPAPAHPAPVNPALLRHLQERGKRRENRVADQITRFSGSMKFVYLHAIWFILWIGLGVEDYPFGLLTMIVSLEAIFLSTFVMISQNRADEKRQVIADEQWRTVQEEEQQNEVLLRLSNEILELAKQIHAASATATSPVPTGTQWTASGRGASPVARRTRVLRDAQRQLRRPIVGTVQAHSRRTRPVTATKES